MSNKFYSCTDDRDGGDPSSMDGDYIIGSPLSLEEIGILSAGTKIYVPINYTRLEGTPFPVSLQPEAFSPEVVLDEYTLEHDLPYLIPSPGWDKDYKCWECRPGEMTCYDANVNGIPRPCAWWQEPFLWICSVRALKK